MPLLKASRRSFPFVERAFADSAYAAERVAEASWIAIEMVRKPADQVGFAVHPRRWVVERCFALAEPQPTFGEGLRDDNRVRNGLPLHGFSHAPGQAYGSLHLSSESDSQCLCATLVLRGVSVAGA